MTVSIQRKSTQCTAKYLTHRAKYIFMFKKKTRNLEIVFSSIIDLFCLLKLVRWNLNGAWLLLGEKK